MLELKPFNQASILIVDDAEANVTLLERILKRAGYENTTGTTDPREGLNLYVRLESDLIILDLNMPDLDGFGFMAELARSVPVGTYLPVMVITADTTREARERALTMGARDFLTKPFDATEVVLRARNLIETRYLYQRLSERNEALEELVEKRTKELAYKARHFEDLANEKRALLLKLHTAKMGIGDEAEA